MWQVSGTITRQDRSATGHNNSIATEIRQAFPAGQRQVVPLADLPSTEQRPDLLLAFPEELAQQPVQRQVCQAHVLQHLLARHKAAMHAKAAVAATVSRTLHQTATVHHAQVRNMYAHNQADVRHQVAPTDRHTTMAVTAHRQVATTEAAIHQEALPIQAEAAAQVQAAVQAQAMAVGAVAEVSVAVVIAAVAEEVAAAAEEDK